MALLAIVPPKDWVSRTKLLLSRRGQTLLNVDKAYEDYYVTRTPAAMRALHDQLGAYLKEHGGYWDRVDRDRKSEGLMRYIYEKTAPDAFGDRGAAALKARIPESRHGVLHLWKDAVVETQWGMIALEGAFSAGGATLGLLNAQNVIPKDRQDYSTAGALGTKVLGAVVGKGREGYTAVSPSALLDEPVVQKAGPLPVAAIREDATTLQKVRAMLGTAFDTVYNAIRDGVLWVKNKIVATVLKAQGAMINLLSKTAQAVIMYVLKSAAKAAVPFIGAGIDIGRGVFQTISGIKDRLGAYFARRKFMVAPGHPSMIADALETQMNWAIGKGLYSTIKGGAKLAGNFFTAGASAIVDVIAAGIELATKLLMRVCEGAFMRQWIDLVRGVCGNRNEWKADPKGGVWRPRICYDTKAFNGLFELGCEASVCVPMMTLNSGITGDLMMYMKMFEDTGEVVGQKAFDTAAGYFRKLKLLGAEYLKSTGFIFSSSKRDVRGYMYHAVNHHKAGNISKTDGALKFLS